MKQKLSNNPVQRFKQGRAIQKFQTAGTLPVPVTKSLLVPVGQTSVVPVNRSVPAVSRITSVAKPSIFRKIAGLGKFARRLGPWGLAASVILDIENQRQKYVNEKQQAAQQQGATREWKAEHPLERVNRRVSQMVEDAIEANPRQALLDQMDQIDEVTGVKRAPKTTGVTRPKVTYAIPSGVTNVKETQRMLMDLGYDLGKWKDDGVWGERTNAAYNQYLQDQAAQAAQTVAPTLPTSEQLVAHVTGQDNYSNATSMYNQMANLTNGFTQQATYQQVPELVANRSDIRQLISDVTGNNPYKYTGYQRRALRNYINGNDYDANALAVFDLSKFDPYKASVLAQQYYKKGGNLISRNAVQRFKNRNFI